MTLARLDTIIAFVVVVLAISLMITILNQMIASVLAYRGRQLRDGIIDLLNTLAPSIDVKDAEKITKDALAHKLVSDSIFANCKCRLIPKCWRLATSVNADELSKVLVLCSKEKNTYKTTDIQSQIETMLSEMNPALERKAKLIVGTVNNLTGSSATADQLIKQLSDKASEEIGRFKAAFNSTMDRVSQRFTLKMRIWTVAFSIVIAAVGHIDALRLYSQISTEPALRASLTTASDGLLKVAGEVTTENRDRTVKQLAENYNSISKDLTATGVQVINIPSCWYSYTLKEVAGIVVMAAFLSLGSPFWYNALKGLTSLRPMIAKKAQEQSTD